MERQEVRKRAGERCEYCRLPDWLTGSGPFHVEHILPRQHGGADEAVNLAWACSRCNCHKGTNLVAIDPDSALRVSLFHPREQQWDEHFTCEGPRIHGHTAIGRATAWLLQMNSERRLEIRSLLIRAGLW
jgi:hypothetical protein